MEIISIVTVTFNCVNSIEKTIQSVLGQTYPYKEYIIIDGGSTDGTLDVINKYKDRINILVSEPDEGVYDAMNKGIALASGAWVNMMNAGDVFYSSDVLSNIFEKGGLADVDVVYSDYMMDFRNRKVLAKASIEKGDILHQAIIYRKSLHSLYGIYAVTKPLIASDFLFFCLIPKDRFFKTPFVISQYDMGGLSNQGNWCYLQLSVLRYVFHKMSIDQLMKILIKEYVKMRMPSFLWKIYSTCKSLIK